MVDKQKKRHNFIKLAERRVNSALDQLRLVGNLSDKRHYEYTDKEMEAILKELTNELNATKLRFKKSSNGKRKFKLWNR